MTDKDEKQVRRREFMQTGSIPKVITSMALPSIVAFLINSVYSLADTYFVSSLGTDATAAVSVNATLDRIIMLAGSMAAVGASSYISRLMGGREEEKADKVLSTVFFLALGFGTVIMVIGLLFTHPMVRLLGATDTCEQYSMEYARYVLMAAPMMAANFVTNQCLRAEGSSVLSMVGMGAGGIINMILDPIFIFRLGLGVTGASIATAISKLISFCILMYPYLRGKSVLHISIRSIGLSLKDFMEIITIGSSSLFRSLMAIVSAIILNNIAGRISVSMLAAVGVANRIMRFPFGVLLGFGNGFQPVAGFNWGGKQYKRLWEGYRFAALTAIIGSIFMGVGLAVFTEPLIGAFTQGDSFMQRYGALCIRMECLALPVQGWVVIVNMLCAGIGNAKGAFLLSISRQGLLFIPIIYPMAYFFGAGGIASAQAVADLLTLLIAVPLLIQIRKKLRLLETGQSIKERVI